MSKKKCWILRLFLILFTISVAVAVLPCGIIIVHGLFGEEVTSIAVNDKEQEITNIRTTSHEKVQPEKGINIFNVWFEILITVIYIRFCANLARLPRGDTIITLKVRMDH